MFKNKDRSRGELQDLASSTAKHVRFIAESMIDAKQELWTSLPQRIQKLLAQEIHMSRASDEEAWNALYSGPTAGTSMCTWPRKGTRRLVWVTPGPLRSYHLQAAREKKDLDWGRGFI